MIIYFISGLGADERVFQKLIFPDTFVVKHIKWIKPIKKETIKEYAFRLSKQIDSSQPFSIIGLSFGGIMVIEITKILNPEKAIIISSIRKKNELPWYFKLIGNLRIHQIIPLRIFAKPNAFLFWIFGMKNDEERKLLSQIILDTNSFYLRWSLNAILSWRSGPLNPEILHIHGTKDRIFPIRFVNPNVKIENGGHFAVFSMADEIKKELIILLGKR